jgi:hypothetical protein
VSAPGEFSRRYRSAVEDFRTESERLAAYRERVARNRRQVQADRRKIRIAVGMIAAVVIACLAIAFRGMLR